MIPDEVFKMLPQNGQKLCFYFRPGDLYNALKILSVPKVDSAFKIMQLSDLWLEGCPLKDSDFDVWNIP